MRQIGTLPAAERPKAGQLANELRRELEALFVEKSEEFAGTGKKKDNLLDLSLPGRRIPVGRPHPVTIVMDEVCDIFEGTRIHRCRGTGHRTRFL